MGLAGNLSETSCNPALGLYANFVRGCLFGIFGIFLDGLDSLFLAGVVLLRLRRICQEKTHVKDA